MKYRTQPQS